MADTRINELIGKTLVAVERNGDDDMIRFVADDGSEYAMHHLQDCCESVVIKDISGDLSDLVGSPITMAEEVVSEGGDPPPESPDSWTWTFYKFATLKGYVTISWLGESNGYYSEGVDFQREKEARP